jgi:hypothetical protein
MENREMAFSVVSPEKEKQLLERMRALGVREQDVEEQLSLATWPKEQFIRLFPPHVSEQRICGGPGEELGFGEVPTKPLSPQQYVDT